MATTSNNNDTTKRYDVGSDDTSSNYQQLASTYNNSANQTTDYYNALNDESYKTMLNSEIQASQAKQQALKYTQNALQANGYSGQGVSESTMAGINASYNNALSNAYATYQGALNTNNVAKQQALSDLDQNYYSALNTQQQFNYQKEQDALDRDYQERQFAYNQQLTAQEKADTEASNLATNIKNDLENYSEDSKTLAQVLNDYGIADANGNIDTTKLAALGLSSADQKSVLSMYNYLNNKATEQTETEETNASTIGSVTTANALMKNYYQYSKDEEITDTNNDTYKVAANSSTKSANTLNYAPQAAKYLKNGSYSINNATIEKVFGSNALSKLSQDDGNITYIGKVADKTWASNLGLDTNKNYYVMAINDTDWVILEK